MGRRAWLIPGDAVAGETLVGDRHHSLRVARAEKRITEPKT